MFSNNNDKYVDKNVDIIYYYLLQMSSYWGNPTWALFHTLANHVSENSFPTIKNQLIHIIIQICKHLPCPECTIHAESFWKKTNLRLIQNKQDLITVLYVFHNCVNKRKHKEIFKFAQLSIYDSYNLMQVYNEFVRNFHTNGNMKLLSETFHRNTMLLQLKKWFMQNIHHFVRPRKPPQIVSTNDTKPSEETSNNGEETNSTTTDK